MSATDLQGGPDQKVELVVWPTEEPEIPPPPERPARGWKAEQVESKSEPDEMPAGMEKDSTHAYIWQRPKEAAAVVRTMICRDDGGGEDGPVAAMTTRQVVAGLMAGLGPEVGSAVLKHLDREGEAEYVAGAVAEEPQVLHSTAVHVLEVVRQRMVSGDYLEDGGPGFALELLEKAFGSHRAPRLLRSGTGESADGFSALKGVAPEQIAPFISHEHPQTIALTLSQLAPAQAAGILAQLPQRMQADVAYRVATMENITPAVLKEIDEALDASLRDILGGNQDVGGPKVVADLLNMTGSSVEKNVRDQMDAQDPEVAEAVRNLMFMFVDIAKLTDRELQALLREVDQKDMVIALKACNDELKSKMLGNMSERVRTFISEEMEKLGPMRLTEVEEVQLRIVQQVRQLEEQGKVTIIRGDSEDTFV